MSNKGSSASYYPEDYQAARASFIAAAASTGALHQSFVVNDSCNHIEEQPLTIDVAELGQGNDLVVVSSGLHGVEGYFGSAVQLALLDRFETGNLPGRLLLIHAVNPWGFHHSRRVNENNIDLNRNFRSDGFGGAPEGYRHLNGFLNPQRLPSAIELFGARAVAKIIRHGMSSLKESVASGQYEFAQGLFYGGAELSQSALLMAANMQRWVGNARKVLHIDLHTGLGRYGQLRLLCGNKESAATRDWYEQTFSHETVESLNANSGTAYPVNGQFGDWLQSQFSGIDYRFIGAEYGTYSVLKVLDALRAENRYHFYGNPQSNDYVNSKRTLIECFCPADVEWRRQVLSNAVSVVEKGARAL